MLYERVDNMSCEKETWVEINDFICTQKHWMLNQFQVIMGYIQLDKRDMAFEFIKRATSEVEGTAAFTKLSDAEIGARLCLLWWRMCENNINLFPIIDTNINLRDKERFFSSLDPFMEDLKERYAEYIVDRHITWMIKSEEGNVVCAFKCDEEFDLPNLYAENEQFSGKITVNNGVLVYTVKN